MVHLRAKIENSPQKPSIIFRISNDALNFLKQQLITYLTDDSLSSNIFRQCLYCLSALGSIFLQNSLFLYLFFNSVN